jgi:hypothetical protein
MKPEPISPELALVDDQLDISARDALPDAPDCLAAVAHATSTTRSGGRAVSQRLAGVAVLVVVAAIGTFLISYDSGLNGIRSVSPLATEGESHRLRWRPIRGAVFYNVIFWRDGKRALDLWPTTTSVRVPEDRLGPGEYQWFVYPSFGKGEALRYGRVAARGTFKL